jgi:hypothetical protein
LKVDNDQDLSEGNTVDCHVDKMIDLLTPEIEHIVKTWSNGEVVSFVHALSAEIEEEAFARFFNGEGQLDGLDSSAREFV